MAKITVAALLAVGCLSFTEENTVPDPQISIVPDPPIRGQQATLIGPPNTVLNFTDGYPVGLWPTSVTTDANGEAMFLVPKNGTSATISAAGSGWSGLAVVTTGL